MKKILLSTLFIFFYCIGFSQNVSYELTEYWTGGNWTITYRNNFTYDANGFLTESLFQKWDTDISSWFDQEKHTYTNNTSGLVTEDFKQSWNINTQLWEDVGKYIYSYTASNKIDTTLYVNWQNNAWENGGRLVVIYNANDLSVMETTEFFSDSTWKLSSHVNREYDSLDRETEITEQNWVEDSLAWINSRRSIFTYLPGDSQQVITGDFWTNNAWKSVFRTTWNFDSTGFKVKDLLEMWDDGTNTWNDFIVQEYTKTSTGKLFQKTTKSWDRDAAAWLNSSRITEVYAGTTGIANINGSLFRMFPNPVTDKLSISLPTTAPSVLSIMNLQGKVLYAMNSSTNETSVDVSALSPGIYIVQVICNNEVSVKKFVRGE